MTVRVEDVRCVDAEGDAVRTVLLRGGRLEALLPPGALPDADLAIRPRAGAVLMPAFVELHAHFREPGFPEKETLESGCLAAAAGGYATAVCMANTRPVVDTVEAARALADRARALGLVDLHPALALTAGMEGIDCSRLRSLPRAGSAGPDFPVRILSEDGKDVADDGVLLEAFRAAAAAGLPVSCHCDSGGAAAAAAKAAGASRAVWSRIEEDAATERALRLADEAGCRVHVAHVSTRAAVEAVRAAKAAYAAGRRSAPVTCEASPHHLYLTEADAERLGSEGPGRVNPPLRTEDDRRALLDAVLDGTVDAIATDHAPHAAADKEAGAPGFTGLETAFGAAAAALAERSLGLRDLSRLLSAAPAGILGLADRGRLREGWRADLVVLAPEETWFVDPAALKSRGKNTPYAGKALRGRVLMTLRAGRITYDGGYR